MFPLSEDQTLFQVPRNTKIFDYNEEEESDTEDMKDYDEDEIEMKKQE